MEEEKIVFNEDYTPIEKITIGEIKPTPKIKWLLAADGSDPSFRACENLVRLAKPNDV